MNVVKLFCAFLRSRNDKIVKAFLPNVGRVDMQIANQGDGAAMLQHLHDERGIAGFRFADEQMKVFGHDHVTLDDELVALTNLLKDVEE